MFAYEEKKAAGKAVRQKEIIHNGGVVQRVFTNGAYQGAITNNYQLAENHWTNANTRVTNFVNHYAGNGAFTNTHMEQNMLDKSIKASTTLAGESFETNEWKALANGNYYGPGGTWGTDIKEFINSNHGGATGTQAGEVKSSMHVNWRNLFNGVGNVWKAAYLEGAALADAQLPANQNPNGQYYVYDKNNVGFGCFRCN